MLGAGHAYEVGRVTLPLLSEQSHDIKLLAYLFHGESQAPSPFFLSASHATAATLEPKARQSECFESLVFAEDPSLLFVFFLLVIALRGVCLLGEPAWLLDHGLGDHFVPLVPLIAAQK